MGFDGSSITGFNAIEESDMVAIPDPETFQLMPWKEGETRVARMICDIVTPDGKPYEGDPRYVLRRALERMASLGFDTFNVGPELEYFLFRDDKGTETLDEGGYFAMTTMDAASDLRQETVRALESMGIPIEYVHHEVGPSQHEIDMRFADALSMADHTVTYRLIVKEIAKKAGYHATFMPKPMFGENGSGMHTHQSLFKDGRNAFFDSDDEWHLSDAGKAFIAGQLRHAREISAVFAQWVNSYKRLVPGYEAPVYVAWSRRNRSALIRIPLYKPGAEQATRAEIRCPDPACNPYLTFATLLHAGLVLGELEPHCAFLPLAYRDRVHDRIDADEFVDILLELVHALDREAQVIHAGRQDRGADVVLDLPRHDHQRHLAVAEIMVGIARLGILLGELEHVRVEACHLVRPHRAHRDVADVARVLLADSLST